MIIIIIKLIDCVEKSCEFIKLQQESGVAS